MNCPHTEICMREENIASGDIIQSEHHALNKQHRGRCGSCSMGPGLVYGAPLSAVQNHKRNHARSNSRVAAVTYIYDYFLAERSRDAPYLSLPRFKNFFKPLALPALALSSLDSDNISLASSFPGSSFFPPSITTIRFETLEKLRIDCRCR